MSTLKAIGQDILDDIKKELRLQGHYDTGELEGSMKVYEAAAKNEHILQGYAMGYIDDLEYGVPARQIKVTEAEFKDLTEWVKRQIGALNQAEATQIAASIVRKWKKEGKPLEGSKQFSATGKVTEAIADAFEKGEKGYIDRIDEVVAKKIDEEFMKPDEGLI